MRVTYNSRAAHATQKGSTRCNPSHDAVHGKQHAARQGTQFKLIMFKVLDLKHNLINLLLKLNPKMHMQF